MVAIGNLFTSRAQLTKCRQWKKLISPRATATSESWKNNRGAIDANENQKFIAILILHSARYVSSYWCCLSSCAVVSTRAPIERREEKKNNNEIVYKHHQSLLHAIIISMRRVCVCVRWWMECLGGGASSLSFFQTLLYAGFHRRHHNVSPSWRMRPHQPLSRGTQKINKKSLKFRRVCKRVALVAVLKSRTS